MRKNVVYFIPIIFLCVSVVYFVGGILMKPSELRGSIKIVREEMETTVSEPFALREPEWEYLGCTTLDFSASTVGGLEELRPIAFQEISFLKEKNMVQFYGHYISFEDMDINLFPYLIEEASNPKDGAVYLAVMGRQVKQVRVFDCIEFLRRSTVFQDSYGNQLKHWIELPLPVFVFDETYTDNTVYVYRTNEEYRNPLYAYSQQEAKGSWNDSALQMNKQDQFVIHREAEK
ncbi:MAG: hypothetical protein E7655_02795 [Ruminococcaceae bacterium]|nr:hypothetical protein [Oscillospiraceae bacterium]